MSTNKTTNYQLHKWEAEDDFLRSEFNENFVAIDTALGCKAEIVTGAYTGDGAASRTISLGFTPKAVLLMLQEGMMANSSGYYYGGLAFLNTPAAYGSKSSAIFSIVADGFQVSSAGNARANKSGEVYHYLAVK